MQNGAVKWTDDQDEELAVALALLQAAFPVRSALARKLGVRTSAVTRWYSHLHHPRPGTRAAIVRLSRDPVSRGAVTSATMPAEIAPEEWECLGYYRSLSLRDRAWLIEVLKRLGGAPESAVFHEAAWNGTERRSGRDRRQTG